ncbi:acyl-CoA thioesterase domain-containing protein [Streptomyces sp. ISL-43]|uniref:acyl-CoA thioesterase domain-containing protein n=1 Tax=Streptomyces sp. ISL-43 TaxID=2819183 RepID=UPI0035A9A097
MTLQRQWWSGSDSCVSDILSVCSLDSDRPVLHWRGQGISGAELNRSVLEIFHALRDNGVRKGDVIAVLVAPNSPEMLTVAMPRTCWEAPSATCGPPIPSAARRSFHRSMLRNAGEGLPAGLVPRALHSSFLAPVSDRGLLVRSDVVRRSRSSAVVRSVILQHERPVALGTALFGAGVAEPTVQASPPPAVPAPERCPDAGFPPLGGRKTDRSWPGRAAVSRVLRPATVMRVAAGSRCTDVRRSAAPRRSSRQSMVGTRIGRA